jgi:hypothetical protein
MKETLATLVERMEKPELQDAAVIPWGSPVLAFGDPASSRIATVGLNPSNREFVDAAGCELSERLRRFHTLRSLGLTRWTDIAPRHFGMMLDSFMRYFHSNPYDVWFRALDNLISGTSASFYDRGGACHLDLVPYATAQKWTDLRPSQRSNLLSVSGDTLGLLVRDSHVQVLLLNGATVVQHLQQLTTVSLKAEFVPEWTLPRRSGSGVLGYSYKGWVNTIAGVDLGRNVLVLGFNHNIQSSFGVTTGVRNAIRLWVAESSLEVLA